MAETITAASRYRGALLGLACGDALGAPVEFMEPGTFQPVTGMSGGGKHQLPPGAWTDDTSMALGLAESLLEMERFDAGKALDLWLRWYRHGYLSSTGRCFDIGDSTKEALEWYEVVPDDPYPGEQFPDAKGNGAIMRLAPIPLAYGRHKQREALMAAVDAAGASAATTHGSSDAIDSARYLCGLMLGALRGESVTTLLGGDQPYEPFSGCWEASPLNKRVALIASGGRTFRARQPGPKGIRAAGHVLLTLEAALWAIWNHRNFKDAVLAAVNLGDDADTVGAVCGQIAGAIYGEEAIPEEWHSRLTWRPLIVRRADELLHLCQTGRAPAKNRPVATQASGQTDSEGDPWDELDNHKHEHPVEPEDEVDPEEVAVITGQRGAAGTVEINLESDEIKPGVPVLAWATSKRRGGEFWQRGLCAVTEPLRDAETGEQVVWVTWLVAYANAHARGIPPTAEPWPAHLVVVDPKPPKSQHYQVPEVPPKKPPANKMRNQPAGA